MGVFSVNDYVVYAGSGVCVIEGIERKTFGCVQEDYFILKPVNSANTTFFVPCGNENLASRMRRPMTKREIDELLQSIDGSITWIENKKERPARFREIISRADTKELILLVGCISDKKRELLLKNKSLTSSDEKILSEAERIISDEFSFSLGIDASEVEEYILAARKY